MLCIPRATLVAILAGALLHAPAARAEVIDGIAVERHDAGARIRLRLTAPVHYLRHAPPERGELVVIYLQALEPGAFSEISPIEEVKRAPRDVPVPPFTVRVTVGQVCSTAANPVCIAIRFARPVGYRIRLGEDRRSVVIDLPPADEDDPHPAGAGDKP